MGSGRSSLTTLPHVRAPWLSHVECRADRIQLFFDELPAGEHAVTVWVLASTPGEYVRPAAIAEAMYEPETRARTQADRIVLEGPR